VVVGAHRQHHAAVAVARRWTEGRGVNPYDPESFDADDLDDADRSYLAEWYEALDTQQERMAGRTADAQGEAAAPAQRTTELAEGATYLEVLRHYLVTSKGLDDIPDPVPLISGVLYVDSLAWVVGRPGHGKSLVTLDWMGHVGAGLPWCGLRTRKTNVVYVSPESPGGIKLRVRAWEQAMGQPMNGVYFLPLAPQASIPGHWQALTELCREVGAGLVVLDTQARVTLGLEENSSKDMGVFVDRLERLRDTTKACVLTVHHTSKGGESLRGSSALEGAASTIVTVKKDGDMVTVSADPDHGGKTKDVAAFDPISLRIVPTGSSAIVALAVDLGRDRELSMTVQQALRAWWQSFGSDEVSITRLVSSEIFAERTFQNNRKMLIDQGIIKAEGTRKMRRFSMIPGTAYSPEDPD
jgi:hypothetical protein